WSAANATRRRGSGYGCWRTTAGPACAGAAARSSTRARRRVMAKADKPESAPAKAAGGKPPSGGKPGGPPRGGKGAAAAAKAAPAAAPTKPRSTGQIPPRLRERYRTAIVPALMHERGYQNRHEVPGLVKIVLNMGLGEAKENAKALDAAAADMVAISGQKAVITKAKKSIAAFKVRTGMPVGAKTTLRGARMYEF